MTAPPHAVTKMLQPGCMRRPLMRTNISSRCHRPGGCDRCGREGDVFDLEIRSADRAAMLRKPKLN